jgi:ketol-acid reductoisomerase
VVVAGRLSKKPKKRHGKKARVPLKENIPLKMRRKKMVAHVRIISVQRGYSAVGKMTIIVLQAAMPSAVMAMIIIAAKPESFLGTYTFNNGSPGLFQSGYGAERKMAKLYYDGDADVGVLSGKTIAVIGYGNQGSAQARNLHDSGIDVVVGVREGGNSWERAKSDGLSVSPIEHAAERAEIIHLLVPDEVQSKVYESSIKPYLRAGKVLGFSHGFNITFRWIKPPEDIDLIMVAPKGPGYMVRRLYKEGFGVPALIAVEQDFSGNAKEIALAMAKAMRFTKPGVLETTFYEETTSDLFGEQVVLCGGVSELIKVGFETLVEKGYQPEVAYFECLHELKLITDLIQQGGLGFMWQMVSNTAEFGGRTRGSRIISEATKAEMKKIWDEIEAGKFAEEWRKESDGGMKFLKEQREKEQEEQIEVVGRRIRALFHTKP